MMNTDKIHTVSEFPRKTASFKPWHKQVLTIGIMVMIGAGLVYLALNLPMAPDANAAQQQKDAEFQKLKQEVTFLRNSYQELMSKQTTTPDAIMKRVEELERKSKETPTGSTPNQSHMMQVLLLREIAEKLNAGFPFQDQVTQLLRFNMPTDISLTPLTDLQDREFPTLTDIAASTSLFDAALDDTSEDKSIITQMGDFLKISKDVENEAPSAPAAALTQARADINAHDVQQAYQRLSTHFDTEDQRLSPWFAMTESYLEGRKLNQQIDEWITTLIEQAMGEKS